jgi:EpsD family peptidyl-prolyl cis-trans isomerase
MHFARTASLTLSLALVGLLSACGGDSKDGEEKKATQVAAKVNADEITVHQINSALPRMNNPSEAQVKAATKQALERLIDQQLFIQKAIEGKLDRDPQVMTAIENSRREILARAYVERVMANATADDPAKIKDFYDQHPELFSQRRVYRLQEVALQVRGEELEKLKQALPPMKSLQEVIAYAKANNLRATTNASVRAAEQLPMEFAKRIAALKDGEVVAVPGPNGVAVIQIVASQQQPLDEAKAKPFIEQFLQNKSRMELAQAELKSLRAAAKIEYVGDFAKPAEEAAPAEGNGGMGSSLEQQAGQQPVPATGGGDDDDALQKGLSGLKK